VPPAPVDLLLPAGLDGAEALALLQSRLRLDVGAARTRDRVLLDSFDGRLRAAGLEAERAAATRGTTTIELRETGAPVRRAKIAPARRHLAHELPEGGVRERLEPVLEERALLPMARVRSSVRSLAVLNGDEKSVVRLSIEAPVAVLATGRVPLATRLSVRPVLGYDGAYERTLATLRDELGLQAAKRSLYDDAVRAAGGKPRGIATKVRVPLDPGTHTDAAAALVLRRLAKVAEANVAGTVEDLDPEFLHDLRVSIRRARAVLRELRGVLEPRERARLRDELKWAQALTGPMRDLDVQLLEWPELTDGLAGERGAELEPLRALLERRRARERAKLVRGLRSARFAGMLAAWRALADGRSSGDEKATPRAALPIERTAGGRIVKVYRRMVRDGRAIGADTPAEALHDLRKSGKELRYLLELFGGAFDAGTVDETVKALKGLQTVLGRYQDRAVQIESLRALRDELAGEPDGPAALLALGPVLELLAADQAAAREEYEERFEAFAAKPNRAAVRAAFGGRGT
jgi:CHAD domain-containing protein